MNKKQPVVLVILDGWGEWDIKIGNAILQSKLPTVGYLNKYYPKLLLQASGLAVGLPWGVRGNSEVGHQALGSGQIIYQHLPAIDMAVQDGSFIRNQVLLDTFSYVNKNKKKLHLVGLVSDGSVHSHISHLSALLGATKKEGVKNVFIHAITDGRDTPPQSALKYIEMVEKMADKLGVGEIASLAGRYFAMDRNNNWERTLQAYQAMTGEAGLKFRDTVSAIENQYTKKVYDEYLEPVIICDRKNRPIGAVEEGDAIICFNYRKDRSRQITKAFVASDLPEFKNHHRPAGIKFVVFTEYEAGLVPDVIFPEQKISSRLGKILSEAGKKQLRLAETEKYAHVTYFFNGGDEKAYQGEDRVMVPSKKIDTYAKIPEMSAEEVTAEAIQAIEKKNYDFILINYANPDMVGHTGDLKAGIKAVEKVDNCLGRLIEIVLNKNGRLIITADHGNAEEMIKVADMSRDTEHSTNPVPCWYVAKESQKTQEQKDFGSQMEGMIIDIAPTILELLGLPAPEEMTGRSLLPLFKSKI